MVLTGGTRVLIGVVNSHPSAAPPGGEIERERERERERPALPTHSLSV